MPKSIIHGTQLLTCMMAGSKLRSGNSCMLAMSALVSVGTAF
jgi:hypothetical protein